MTIHHMEIYIQVYKTQNITHAAELLHMTQPAVSRAIREIEAYYGIRLFERINKRLYITAAGKLFYAQAQHIIESFEQMEKELKNWNASGLIRIGASVTIGNFLLPGLLSVFRQKYPTVQVHATIANGNNLQKSLLGSQLDIALIEGLVEEKDLHAEPFADDKLVLILPPGHPLLLQEHIYLPELLDYPLLLREQGSAGRTFLDQVYGILGKTLHPTWESVSTQAIVKAVHMGLGISFLPEQLVRQDLVNGFVCTRKISDVDLTRKHYLVWHKDKFLTQSMHNLISICKNMGRFSTEIPEDTI